MSQKLTDATVVVGLSGGVDSAVAAARLQLSGARVVGVTLLLADDQDCGDQEGVCCSRKEADSALLVAQTLGIPHYRIDLRERFRRAVITEAVRVAAWGGTPSVCPVCNARIKMAALAEKANELGAEYIATGHYARIERTGNEVRLLRGTVRQRDQSYFLYAIPLSLQRRLLLPLSESSKSEIRSEAASLDMKVHDRPASQDLCPGLESALAEQIAAGAPEMALPGAIIDHHGHHLGEHRGLFRYTNGQRRGLGLGGGTAEPLYVIGKDFDNRTLLVGHEELLWSRNITVKLNGPRREPLPDGLSCQPRRNHSGAPVEVLSLKDNLLHARFLTPQRALTPGQIAVFYLGEEVVAGGTAVMPD